MLVLAGGEPVVKRGVLGRQDRLGCEFKWVFADYTPTTLTAIIHCLCITLMLLANEI